MSEAYRCDITGDCIAKGESPNSYWTISSGKTTVLGVADVEIELVAKVTVPGIPGDRAHLSQTARTEVMRIIKNYITNNF